MVKTVRVILVAVSLCIFAVTAFAQATPCPGYNPNHNVNLACQIPTTIRVSTSGTQTLGSLSPTLAAQLSQLPTATAISGSGLTFSRSLGVFTASTDSLGTILTQRGETLGRHKLFVSFNYQRFGFGSENDSVGCPGIVQGFHADPIAHKHQPLFPRVPDCSSKHSRRT